MTAKFLRWKILILESLQVSHSLLIPLHLSFFFKHFSGPYHECAENSNKFGFGASNGCSWFTSFPALLESREAHILYASKWEERKLIKRIKIGIKFSMQLECHTKATIPPAAAIASRFLSSKDKFHKAPAASCLFVSNFMKFQEQLQHQEQAKVK